MCAPSENVPGVVLLRVHIGTWRNKRYDGGIITLLCKVSARAREVMDTAKIVSGKVAAKQYSPKEQRSPDILSCEGQKYAAKSNIRAATFTRNVADVLKHPMVASESGSPLDVVPVAITSTPSSCLPPSSLVHVDQ